MLFNSLEFLWFFPVVFTLYYATSHNTRLIILLIASYIFYAYWHPSFLIWLLFSTLIDYVAALLINKFPTKAFKRLYLSFSLITNLGLLVSFKYINFLIGNLNSVYRFINLPTELPLTNWILPVGISFYTFQTLSYTLDVFSGKIKAERDLIIFALYVTFFPQLVAGPVERSKNLLPQLKKNHIFDYTNVVIGLRRILWGFFQKLVIADQAAIYVNTVYASPDAHKGFSTIFASILFYFQLYCDFAGYTNIAIGTAQTMGIKLKENFKRPLFASSVTEFWQRWHISISTWFRDYVFIPLARNSQSKATRNIYLLITFIVIGFWHGANWTFICFGLIHGLYVVTENLLKLSKRSKPLAKASHETGIVFKPIIFNFLPIRVFVLVTLSGVFFRSQTVPQAFSVIKNMFAIDNLKISLQGFDYYRICLLLIAISILITIEIIEEKSKDTIYNLIDNLKKPVRWSVYVSLLVGILLFGNFNSQEFIYFQF